MRSIMNSRFVLRDEDIVILGEKDIQNDKSDNLDNACVSVLPDGNTSNQQNSEVLNARVDSKGGLHAKDGKYLTKAGITKKSVVTGIPIIDDNIQTNIGESNG